MKKINKFLKRMTTIGETLTSCFGFGRRKRSRQGAIYPEEIEMQIIVGEYQPAEEVHYEVPVADDAIQDEFLLEELAKTEVTVIDYQEPALEDVSSEELISFENSIEPWVDIDIDVGQPAYNEELPAEDFGTGLPPDFRASWQDFFLAFSVDDDSLTGAGPASDDVHVDGGEAVNEEFSVEDNLTEPAMDDEEYSKQVYFPGEMWETLEEKLEFENQLYVERNGWYFDVADESTHEVCAAIEQRAASAHEQQYGGRHYIVVPYDEYWADLIDPFQPTSDPDTPLFTIIEEMKSLGFLITTGWLIIPGQPFVVLFKTPSARSEAFDFVRSKGRNMTTEHIESLCTEDAVFQYMVAVFFTILNKIMRPDENGTWKPPIVIRQYLKGNYY